MLNEIYTTICSLLSFISTNINNSREKEAISFSSLFLLRLAMKWMAYSMVLASCDKEELGPYYSYVQEYKNNKVLELPFGFSKDFPQYFLSSPNTDFIELNWFLNNYYIADKLGKYEQYRYKTVYDPIVTASTLYDIVLISFNFVKVFNKYSLARKQIDDAFYQVFNINDYIIFSYKLL